MEHLTELAQAHQIFEFCGLVVAAILASAVAHQSTRDDWAIMPLSFVVTFTSLLLLGPDATMLVVIAGTVTERLTGSQRAHTPRQLVLNGLTAIAAVQAAGFVYRALGGTMGHFVWPVAGVSTAAAIAVYCFVTSAAAEIIVPFVTRQPVNRSWPKSIVRGVPSYFIGASVAVGFVDLIDHRVWDILPAAAVPLYFVYRAYCDQVHRLDEEHRRREVIDSLDHGMAVVDSHGQVALWNDGLERILGCRREQALGRSLASVIPTLAKIELARANHDTVIERRARTLAPLAFPSAAGVRMLQFKMLPVSGGMTVLCDDVTERVTAEQAAKRSEERLALAAEGANDGLWELDVRRQELYLSSRWRALLGQSAPAGIGRPEEWMDRVHAGDIAALKEALDAHLTGKTDHFQHEHRIRHEDGTYRRFLCRGLAARRIGARSVRIAGSLTDTTEQAIAREKSHSAAFLDPLTGLSNRAVFIDALGRRLEEFKAQRVGSRFAALYLDLDRLKVVNDSLGHLVGDELLAAVARRLEPCLRPGDALARLGGDEFAILLNEVGDSTQANAVAFRIQKSLAAPFSVGGREVFTSISIGIAVAKAEYNSPDEMLRDADTALYHAKARGKARHELFDAHMHARELDRVGLENDLRRAVNDNDFEVHYQPIVLLASRRCVGFESLIRWTRHGKAVSPVTFIPLAEELGIIEPLGTWVLQQACSTFAAWRRRFPDAGLDYITVNVSSRQLMQQNFLGVVEQAVHAAGLKPCDLRLEITETAVMDNPQEAATLLRELRAFGAKIYLDDFGCGYSSLSHLHKLPVDALKIDRSFVKSLLFPDRPAIVESILALARTLNTSAVAEGVEEDLQACELERLGCTHAQGYLFSRPLSTSAAETLLGTNGPLGPKRIEPSDPAKTEHPNLYRSSQAVDRPELVPIGL